MPCRLQFQPITWSTMRSGLRLDTRASLIPGEEKVVIAPDTVASREGTA